jgi:hypothetical protein
LNVQTLKFKIVEDITLKDHKGGFNGSPRNYRNFTRLVGQQLKNVDSNSKIFPTSIYARLSIVTKTYLSNTMKQKPQNVQISQSKTLKKEEGLTVAKEIVRVLMWGRSGDSNSMRAGLKEIREVR